MVGKRDKLKNSSYYIITIYFHIWPCILFISSNFCIKKKVSVSTNIGENFKVPIPIP